MKKTVSIGISFISALAVLLIAASPAAAASFLVSMVDLTKSGIVHLYLEGASGPVNTVTVAGFDSYLTSCSSSGGNQLVCDIQGQIAQQHGGETAYILMNGEKVFFVVPKLPENQHNRCRRPPTSPVILQPFRPCGGGQD
jgi:hypothetical protein